MKKLSLALAFMSIGMSYAQQKAEVVHSTSISVPCHGVTEHLHPFIEPSRTINQVAIIAK